MTLGETIKRTRKSQKTSRVDLAKRAGITPQMLYMLEAGQRHGTPETLSKVSTALGLPLPVLMWVTLTEEDVPPSKRTAYRALKPTVDNLISTIFQIDLAK